MKYLHHYHSQNILAQVEEWGNMYMILYETINPWVVTPLIGWLLGGFHHRVARKILVKKTRQQKDGNWYYPTLGEYMKALGLEDMETYI